MTNTPAITWTRVLKISGISLLVLMMANRFVRWIDLHVVDIDRPPYWPVGVFEPIAPTLWRVSVAAACLFAGWFLFNWLQRRGNRIVEVILVGLVLVLGSNLIQGWEGAFVTPIAGTPEGKAIQYYHDAATVADPRHFFTHYTEVQAGLNDHARSHPPGAVVSIYFLNKLLGSPAAISLAIATLAVVLTGIIVHWFLVLKLRSRNVEGAESLAGYGTVLLLLTPAMQIYSCASLDALIVPTMFGAVALIVHKRPVIAILGSSLCLLAASMLTFAACFAPCVMFAFEWHRTRRLNRSITAVLIVVSAWIAMELTSGFNYWRSFQIASAIENPDGFRLLADPISYIFTRVECVAEIALFLSPVLCVLLVQGLRKSAATKDGFASLTRLAVLVLTAIFATGAFHTAETARACLFIYPFLMPAILAGMVEIDLRQKQIVAMAVFGQTVLMQLAGSYFW